MSQPVRTLRAMTQSTATPAPVPNPSNRRAWLVLHRPRAVEASEPSPVAGSPKIDGKALATFFVGIGAVLYAVARAAATEFHSPFGLDPEAVGLTRQGLVTDLATLVVTLAVLLAGLVGVGVLEYKFARAVRPLPSGLPGGWRQARSFFALLVVILAPLAMLALLLVASPFTGLARALSFFACLTAILAFWAAAAAGPRATVSARLKALVSTSLAFPVMIALACIGAPARGQRGLLVLGLFSAVALGLAIRARSSSDAWLATRGVVLSLFPLWALLLLAAAASGVLRGLVTLVMYFALFGWQVAYVAGAPVDQEVTDDLFLNGRPRIASVVGLTVACLAITVLVFAVWKSAAKDGRELYETGKMPGGVATLFASKVSPAMVIAKGTDPLQVCDGSRVAILLGRAHGVSQVFWIPVSHESKSLKVVLPLREEDYVVATGVPEPLPCQATR